MARETGRLRTHISKKPRCGAPDFVVVRPGPPAGQSLSSGIDGPTSDFFLVNQKSSRPTKHDVAGVTSRLKVSQLYSAKKVDRKIT